MAGAKFDIGVNVVTSSWPPGQHPPAAFTAAPQTHQVDYFKMLLTIGILTTPPISRGISLSEYWAQLRYFHAIDFDQTDLKLTPEYDNIDAHQKTILSDDFGMGISCDWLFEKLDIVAFCDGAYFIDNLVGIYGARVAHTPKKRGPKKSPDFIALDAKGLFHVIECKGTQSGDNARNKQVRSVDKNGNLCGGVTQKSVISFPHSCAGERLVSAVRISRHGDDQGTDLQIHDPPGETILEITEQDKKYIRDPLYRGMSARAISLCGARGLASMFAKPIEETARKKSKIEMARDHFWQESFEREIDSFKRVRGTTIGREQETELVQPVHWAGRTYQRVLVRHTCDKELIERAREEVEHKKPFSEHEPYWSEAVTNSVFHTDLPDRAGSGPLEATQRLDLGTSFKSEIILRP